MEKRQLKPYIYEVYDIILFIFAIFMAKIINIELLNYLIIIILGLVSGRTIFNRTLSTTYSISFIVLSLAFIILVNGNALLQLLLLIGSLYIYFKKVN